MSEENKYPLFKYHGGMSLSQAVRIEEKSFYPHRYKHVFDAAQNSQLIIVDEAGYNHFFDGRLDMRFNVNGQIETTTINIVALAAFLRNLEVDSPYKFALKTEQPEEKEFTIKID